MKRKNTFVKIILSFILAAMLCASVISVIPTNIAQVNAAANSLSGGDWCKKFPGSTSLNDLKDPFKTNATKFVNELRARGYTVTINATHRPKERAYLMHYAWEIGKLQQDPSKVPAMDGVNINWVHSTVSQSRQAALDMVNGYGMIANAALNSDHIQGLAMDININGSQTPPQTAIELGKNYGVIWYGSGDPVHWSSSSASNSGSSFSNDFTENEKAVIRQIFSPELYRDANPDVWNAYKDLNKIIDHFLTYAPNEPGRIIKSWSRVFDAGYYLGNNPDVANAVGANNYLGALKHFLNFGINENRLTIDGWYIQYYKIKYPDLQKAFGDSWKNYYVHYCQFGYKEGRIVPTPYTPAQISVIDSIFDESLYAEKNPDVRAVLGTSRKSLLKHFIDFSPMEPGRLNSFSRVFNASFYLNNNKDVANAVKNDPVNALKHFLHFGINENRYTISGWNVQNYKNKYSDLQKAFGNSWENYYVHYCQFGYKEGRTGSP